MKKTTTLIILLITVSLFGQDVTSYGGNFYPTKKTNISLEKEVLSFTVRDDIAFVDILYVFNNPEPKDQKLEVKFTAPAQFSNPLQIKGFTIFHEDQIIPYQLKATECEDCELKDSNFYKDGYGDFVFLFEITFKPGLNTINHSFNFPKDGGIDIYANYNYMLTHGENWGDGNIKHMTINIDMGPNQYFFISDIFGKTADWSIIGTGKLTNESSSYFTEFPYKFIRILSGKLQITTSNFKADSNLDFGMFSQYFFTSSIGGYYREEALLFYKDYYGDEEFTKNELRILRNTIYAQHGYVFKSAELKKHFKQFAWYMPNPNLKMEDIILTKTEEIIVNKLLELEK